VKLAQSAAGVAEAWLCRLFNLRPRRLPVLVLMVTDKCQLRCTMCGACDYSPGDHNMLSLEEWKAVVDSAARLRTGIISITGGEALLRRDLFELIAHIRSYGMAVHLNSNGLLLNEKNVAQLHALGVETVSISLESVDAPTHDAIRGAGMFERTVKGIRTLRAGAPEVRIGVNCVVNKHNLDTLPAMPEWAAREGVDQLKFAPIHTNLQHKDKPVGSYADMIFREADIPAFEGVMQKIEGALHALHLQTTSAPFFAGMSSLYRPGNSNFYCYAGYAIAVIDAQGNVAACFDKAGAANVRERPLDEIWRSDAFQQHRQQVRHCDANCWDTTNAELSLRLNPLTLLRYPRDSMRAVRFYMARRRGARTAGAR
jgi:MoaA/NifB/PqqE/SkfB family radical SAM enzyme